MSGHVCAGVDGCKAGWVVVLRAPGQAPEVGVVADFAALLDALPDTAIVAVDMPIGLPDRAGPGGRGPEAAIRAILAKRRSSVFSVPSRAAVYTRTEIKYLSDPARKAAYRDVCGVAALTSEPSRKISQQSFAILPKIQEVDEVLRDNPDLRVRVLESHPEAAFWRLNGGSEMAKPKKSLEGSLERRALLVRYGLPSSFLEARPPRGAASDDYLDACAMLLVAERHARGEAVPFPDTPLADAYGIPVAIWT